MYIPSLLQTLDHVDKYKIFVLPGHKLYCERRKNLLSEIIDSKILPTKMVGMAELGNVTGHALFGNSTIRLKVEELLLTSS